MGSAGEQHQLAASGARSYLPDLWAKMCGLFNLEDVRGLCFSLGIDYGNVRGETKDGRIRELLILLQHRGRLQELIVNLRKERPHVDWPDVPLYVPLLPSVLKEKPWEAPEPKAEELALIPSGKFLMGSDQHTIPEKSQHLIDLPAYEIAIFPVTNEQFAYFIRDTGRVPGDALLWDGNEPPGDNKPVAGVTWYEAMEYCNWLKERTGKRYRLPNEAQWEKAARSTDGRLFPWGDTWDQGRCNTAAEITAVNAFPPQSVYGCYDMVGNVREWTVTAWGQKPALPDKLFAYPWQPDRRNCPGEPETTRRVCRGGRMAIPIGFRCSARRSCLPRKMGPSRNRIGFRVALLLEN